jgi:hypothetical protein
VVGTAKDVFARRGIGPDQVPAASVPLLPPDQAAETRRASVSSSVPWPRDSRRTRRTSSSVKPVDGPINDRIDDAYRAKYKGSPYLSPMIGARARYATVKVTPRDTRA